MAAMAEDSANRDEAGGIKDYCDQAAANLKAGRLKEVYLFANEALELDEEDARTTALYRHALYALRPTKRLLDKVKALQEEADQCMKAEDYDKALELLSQAKKWHCTLGILYTRGDVNSLRGRFDLAYVDYTEGLAKCKEDKLSFATGQLSALSRLGYKVLPVIKDDPYPQSDEMPARYNVNSWPKGLRVNRLRVHLVEGYAEAMKTDGTVLKPYIPLDQLAQFLNNHVQGAMQSVSFGSDGRPQDMVPRLLDGVTVPGRLHVSTLNFTGFFHLPWASIKRILDGQTLRASKISFTRLQLPSGVDANELLQLPTVRGCPGLFFSLYTRYGPQPRGLPLLFNNSGLLEWIKCSGGRSLQLASDYLSSGLLSFLDAIKKDFQQAAQVHSYNVKINCPHIDVVAGLGVRDEELLNRLGEKLEIEVGEDPGATLLMGHQFETVVVSRMPPS